MKNKLNEISTKSVEKTIYEHVAKSMDLILANLSLAKPQDLSLAKINKGDAMAKKKASKKKIAKKKTK